MRQVKRTLPLYKRRTGHQRDHRAESRVGMGTSWSPALTVNRKDFAGHGEYRTKRCILVTNDAMAEAIEPAFHASLAFGDLLTQDG